MRRLVYAALVFSLYVLACEDAAAPSAPSMPAQDDGGVAEASSDAGDLPQLDSSTPDAGAVLARDDQATTARGTPVIVRVMANDMTPNGARIETWSDAAKGAPTLRNDGAFEYRPIPGTDGEDTFEYTLRSGDTTSKATVRVQILPQEGRVANGQLYLVDTYLPSSVTGISDPITGSQINGVNAAGEMAGTLYAAGAGSPIGYAFFRSDKGQYGLVPFPAGTQKSEARGINASGVVSGLYYDAEGHEHGFIWNARAHEDAATSFQTAPGVRT